jgi:hypothetical protein
MGLLHQLTSKEHGSHTRPAAVIQNTGLPHPAISCHPKPWAHTPFRQQSFLALASTACHVISCHPQQEADIYCHHLLFTAQDSRILPSAVTTDRCSRTLSSACHQLSSTTGRCSQTLSSACHQLSFTTGSLPPHSLPPSYYGAATERWILKRIHTTTEFDLIISTFTEKPILFKTGQ